MSQEEAKSQAFRVCNRLNKTDDLPLFRVQENFPISQYFHGIRYLQPAGYKVFSEQVSIYIPNEETGETDIFAKFRSTRKELAGKLFGITTKYTRNTLDDLFDDVCKYYTEGTLPFKIGDFDVDVSRE